MYLDQSIDIDKVIYGGVPLQNVRNQTDVYPGKKGPASTFFPVDCTKSPTPDWCSHEITLTHSRSAEFLRFNGLRFVSPVDYYLQLGNRKSSLMRAVLRESTVTHGQVPW